MAPPLTRRRLLEAAALAGLAAPALLGCGTQPAAHEPPGAGTRRHGLGRDYLALGLMGLAVAHERGWARGHHGAAVIAGHYFCQEHDLDDRTVRAVRAQIEAFVQHRRAEFPPLDPGPGRADVEPILEQLATHVHELRSGGHDAIYASLALKALRDVPEFATPRIVDGIRRLLVSFVDTLPVVEETRWQREHPLPPFEDTHALRRATRTALLRPWESVVSLGAGQVVHWVTHADAILTLEELGHGALARRAFAAHQRYIHHPQGKGAGSGPEQPTLGWLEHAYWESAAPRRPQKGTWFFGHSFKLPYSLYRLLRGETDEAVRRACLARGSQLHVPFV